MTPGNDRPTIMTFALVALLILGIACVNFVNLATARASRARPRGGLRKVLGAMRRQLIVQFLGEAMLMALAACWSLSRSSSCTLPALSAFLGDALTLPTMRGLAACCCRCSASLWSSALLGGLYPAFYLSGFSPAAVLKANQPGDRPGVGAAAHHPGRGAILRLDRPDHLHGDHLCCRPNMSALPTPAIDRDGLLVIENLDRDAVAPSAEAIRDEVARLHGVVDGRARRPDPRQRPADDRPCLAAGTDRAGLDRLLRGRRALLRGHGHPARRRPELLGKLGGGRFDRCARRRSAARRQRERCAQRSRRAPARLPHPRGGGRPAVPRQRRRGQHHRRHRRRPVPVDARRDGADPLLHDAQRARQPRRPLRRRMPRTPWSRGSARSGSAARPTCPSSRCSSRTSCRACTMPTRRAGRCSPPARCSPSSSAASASTRSPPSPPSGAPGRSASARCSARGPATSCGCSSGSSPSPW